MLCPRGWCGQCWWEQSPGSSTALLPQDWNVWQCCCPGAGLGSGRTLSAFVLTRQPSNQALTAAGKSNNRANNQAELSLSHLYFLSALCQSVGPGNLLMVKERCVFTVLEVGFMGKSVM